MIVWLLRLAMVALVAVPVPVLADQPGNVNVTEYDDVIVLKNGATIRGSISEIKAGEKVVIERADGELLTVPYDRVEAITDEEGLGERRQALKASEPSHKKSLKWAIITQVGMLTGEGLDMLAVSNFNGIMPSPNIFLGAGLGLIFPGGQGSFDLIIDMLPMACDVRFFTEIGRFQPYVDISPGYSIGLGHTGGLHIVLSAGTKLRADGAAPLLQIGYFTQSFGDERETLSFLSATVGVMW